MSKTKKVLITLTIIIALIVIGAVIAVNKIGNNLTVYNDKDFSELDLSAVEDGKYVGSEDATIIKVTVEVTVKDHIITNVALIEHQNGQGKAAETIVNDIVEKNSLEVDAISSATHSSNVIKTAVYNALTQ